MIKENKGLIFKIIKIACIVVALCVIVAGFAFFRGERSKERDIQAYQRGVALIESVEELEALLRSCDFLISSFGRGYVADSLTMLSRGISHAENAGEALGNLGLSYGKESSLPNFCRAFRGYLEELQASFTREYTNIDFKISESELVSLSLFVDCMRKINSEIQQIQKKIVDDENAVKDFFDVAEDIIKSADFGVIWEELGYSPIELSGKFAIISSCKSKVTEEDAQKSAKTHLGKNVTLKGEKISSREGGEIPTAFVYSCSNTSAIISENGGFLLHLTFDTKGGQTDKRISWDTALSVAIRKLEELQLTRLIKLCQKEEENRFLFVFAPMTENGVLCLDEKIIIGVTNDTGRVCLIDALEYYKNHQKDISTGEILDARKIMSEYSLTVTPALCKIESGGKKYLCYKISGGDTPPEERDIYSVLELRDGVYINAVTGKTILIS